MDIARLAGGRGGGGTRGIFRKRRYAPTFSRGWNYTTASIEHLNVGFYQATDLS